MEFGNNDKPDILFLAHRAPYPLDKGDRIRTYHILRFLSSRAHVHLACLADEPVTKEAQRALAEVSVRLHIISLGKTTRLLRGLGSLVCGRTVTEGAFSSGAMRDLIRTWAKDSGFRAAMGSASSMAPYLRMPELANVLAVIHLMDVD